MNSGWNPARLSADLGCVQGRFQGVYTPPKRIENKGLARLTSCKSFCFNQFWDVNQSSFFTFFHRLEALWAALRLSLRRAVPESYFLLSVEPPEELEDVALVDAEPEDGVDAVLAVDADELSPDEDEPPLFTEPALPEALLPA